MTKTEKILLLIAAVFFVAALLLTPRGGTAAKVSSAFEQPLPTPEPPAEDAELVVTLHTAIDINHADAAALTALPGVGSVTAAAIVAYREEHGPFASLEELLLVPGFGEAALNAILAAGTVG